MSLNEVESASVCDLFNAHTDSPINHHMLDMNPTLKQELSQSALLESNTGRDVLELRLGMSMDLSSFGGVDVVPGRIEAGSQLLVMISLMGVRAEGRKRVLGGGYGLVIGGGCVRRQRQRWEIVELRREAWKQREVEA
ncbi:hypothetical protein Droror1_Dr00016152 [Drosera rotundifolia]